MGVAWIIGFTIYFVKRYKRKKLHRKIEAGKALPKKKEPKSPEEKIVIPPDPAVLLGHRLPGEVVFKDKKNNKNTALTPHSNAESGVAGQAVAAHEGVFAAAST
jgi:hypothetical protein